MPCPGHKPTEPCCLIDSQRDLLALVAEAKTDKEIAVAMGISEGAVGNRLARLGNKLEIEVGANRRVRLADWYRQYQLSQPEPGKLPESVVPVARHEKKDSRIRTWPVLRPTVAIGSAAAFLLAAFIAFIVWLLLGGGGTSCTSSTVRAAGGENVQIEFLHPCKGDRVEEAETLQLQDEVRFTLEADLAAGAAPYVLIKSDPTNPREPYWVQGLSEPEDGEWASGVQVGDPITPPGFLYRVCIVLTTQELTQGEKISEAEFSRLPSVCIFARRA